ncbi:cysteine proteinase inhibitor 12-like [Impatiens glandulifera]|uniref:cysteine proteinase inhibitor 12-like n=1 Tax=Impatiens glandulifera TaxID=253017 RepID=UPI001FB0D85C|nr:cysteine proteinase inhibitor 12-like [Impatiens glandulifera]
MLMIRNNNQSFFFLNFLLLVIFTTSCSTMSTLLGGLRDSLTSEQNSAEIDELARFAVDDHNKKQNSLIQFVKVVKAQEQVVAGTLHHLTIEAVDGGNKKLYDTKIWVKPWMNFKEVQEFKHADSGAPSLTSSDLGVKKDGHAPGFQVVPSHDPMVQDAANHAVKSIQQRSNSLFPYELSEILHAKAEVLEESAVFDILLKLKRGDKEEKMKVKVHKNNEGAFVLNHMEPDHST